MLRGQIQETLDTLRGRGVTCEVVGSFARPSAFIDMDSDLDLLIESRGPLSEVEVWDLAWHYLPDVDVDLVFAEHLPPERVALMKDHARE